MRDLRPVHHLIARSLIHPEPIACASDYDFAARFVADEMRGKGIVVIHVTSAVGPCPICACEVTVKEYLT